MDTIEEAHKNIREAEARLRELMGEAIRLQRYADLAEIAQMAEGLSRLLTKRDKTAEVHIGKEGHTRVEAKDNRGMESKGRPKPRAKKAEYPKFIRDGGRLVKIGWSKRGKQEYEHRAPREAIIACARHLSNKVEVGQLFKVEQVLPVPDVSTGEDVPAYQVYLILAWFCSADSVEKKGRDGYILRTDSLAEGEVDALWEKLDMRQG